MNAREEPYLMPRLGIDELRRFAVDLLAAGGLQAEEAAQVARHLVRANECGYASHGVVRIVQYLAQLDRGELAAGAPLEILRETPCLLTADAHWGFGPVQAARLTRRLMDKARQAGVAAGTMIHSGHVGRLGEYCEMAAAEELLALVMVNNHGAVRRVVPPGGKAARLSTNPIAAGIPHGAEPLVVDFCTSATAEGKVRVKRLAGEPCPDGWLLDSQGRPTNDPAALYADPPGAILPFGGAQAYRGFGLSLLVEVLAGALSGGLCSREVAETPVGNCVFMLVLDPEQFGGWEHFRREVAGLVEFVRSCPRQDGVAEIILPGDPERHTRRQSATEGIPLDEGTWAGLVELAERLGVDVPACE